MSVVVAVFSPVEELLAVTVAPGMSELPDFTTPEMENVCAEGESCASELTASSRRMAIRYTAKVQVFEWKDVFPANSAQYFMRRFSGELQEP